MSERSERVSQPPDFCEQNPMISCTEDLQPSNSHILSPGIFNTKKKAERLIALRFYRFGFCYL